MLELFCFKVSLNLVVVAGAIKNWINNFVPQFLACAFLLLAIAWSPLFGYAYEIPKFLVFALTTFLLGVRFLWKPDQLHGIGEIRFFYWAFACLALIGISSISSTQGAIQLALTHFLLWLLLSLFLVFEVKRIGSDLFLEKFINAFSPVVALVVICLILYELLIGEAHPKPFWGNVNIAGDFLALGLFQVLFWLRFYPSKKYKSFMLSIFLGGTLLLVSYSSRAAILGLFLGATFLYRDELKQKAKNAAIKILLALLSLLCVGMFFQKSWASMHNRFSHWINTLSLIADRPFLGGGPGSFTVIYEKYNGMIVPSNERTEHLLVTSPHNFLLETLAEIGVLGTLVCFSFFGWIIYRVFFFKNNKSISRNWVLANLLLYIPSLFFAFPQKLPFTLMFASIIFAMALSLLGDKGVIRLKPALFLRGLLFACSVLCLWRLGTNAYAEYLTMNSRGYLKHQGLKSACSLDPENWRSCAGLARSAISIEEWPLAEWSIRQLELRYKGYHPNLILKGEYYLKKAQVDLACANFIQYQKLFLKPTSVDSIIEKNCKH